MKSGESTEPRGVPPSDTLLREVLHVIGYPDVWCRCAAAPELGALCALAAVGRPLMEIFHGVKWHVAHFVSECDMEFDRGGEMVTQQLRELAERALVEMRAMYGWAKRIDVGGPSSHALHVIDSVGSEFRASVLMALTDESSSHEHRLSEATEAAKKLLMKCQKLEEEAFGWYRNLRDDIEERVRDLARACLSPP